MGREELSVFMNSLGRFSFIVCEFCGCVDRVHVCVFLASLVLLYVCFVYVSQVLKVLCVSQVCKVHVCIFLASSVFVMCVLCVCHWDTSSMFMYFWPLVLLYVCFVYITGTQGPCLCTFSLFIFIMCVLCVCQSVYFWPL